MVDISQDSVVDINILGDLLEEYGKTRNSYDTQAIQYCISKLQVKLNTVNNSVSKTNIKNIIRYLRNIIDTKDKNKEVRFYTDGKTILARPIEVRRFDEYNIQVTDFINVKDTTVLNIQYKKILDALAIEICYKDFDETLATIEDKLEEIGTVTVYEADELLSKFTDIKYNLACNLRISSTVYMTRGRASYTDYFGGGVGKVKDVKYYYNLLDKSANRLMCIVAYEILQRVKDSGINCRLRGVYNDTVVLTVDNNISLSDIKDKMLFDVVLRVLGRKFKFKPDLVTF